MDDQTVPALQFSYEHVGTVVPVGVHIAGLAQVVFHPIATDSRHVRDALRMRILVQQKRHPEARALGFACFVCSPLLCHKDSPSPRPSRRDPLSQFPSQASSVESFFELRRYHPPLPLDKFIESANMSPVENYAKAPLIVAPFFL